MKVYTVFTIDTWEYREPEYLLAVCADVETARMVAEAYLDDEDLDDLEGWVDNLLDKGDGHPLAIREQDLIPTTILLETLDYRPWCRYCGRKEGPCEFADDQPWVEDEDDIGFPVCLSCIEKNTLKPSNITPTLTLVRD